MSDESLVRRRSGPGDLARRLGARSRNRQAGESGGAFRRETFRLPRTEARAKAREEARTKLEEQLAKQKDPPKPLPEFGTTDDFQLQQALNQLSQRPVIVSKTATERKAEVDVN